MANIIIKTNSSSYGTVTPSTTFYLGENQRRKIEATPKSGYKFSHWSRSGNWAVLEDEGGEGDEQTLHTAVVYVRSLTSSTEQNVTFTANFVAKSYSISSYTNNNSYGSAPGLSHTNAVAGTTITITPKPLPGYYLSSIKVSYANAPATTIPVTNNTFTMPAMNVNVYATYAAKAYLSPPTLSISPNSSYISFGTNVVTYSCTHNNSANVSSYNYSVTGNGGPWSYTNKTASLVDSFGYIRIGYTYKVSAQAVAKAGTNYSNSEYSSEKSFTICGKVYCYDINGAVLSGWNGVLATSWESSKVSYSPSGYGAVTWWTSPGGKGTQWQSFSAANFRSETYKGILKLYAYATPTKYTITFNAGSYGTSSKSSESVNVNTQYNLDSVTVTNVQSGKKFLGWSTSQNGSVVHTITIKSNVTVYAIYTDNYTIEYNLNPQAKIDGNGTFIPSPASIAGGTKTKGTPFPITSTVPTMTGYVFANWKDSSDTTYSSGGTYEKEGGTTLTAQWTANKYTPKVAKPDPATAPSYTASIPFWTFNTTQTLPSAPASTEKWAPKTPFWKVTVGSASSLVNAGGTYNFVTAGTPTLQPQWKQITYWRRGQLWIYVPEED